MDDKKPQPTAKTENVKKPIDAFLNGLSALEASFRVKLTDLERMAYLAQLTDIPLNDFNAAIDELQRNWRPEFGVSFPPIRDLLDAVMTVRGRRILAEQSREIQGRPDKPLEKADLTKAGIHLKVTKAEIEQWLEEGRQKQREHAAQLAKDPSWQAMYEKFGKPGLKPQEPRTWDTPEEKAKWASETAKRQGWRRE